jgi:hypothetical protein
MEEVCTMRNSPAEVWGEPCFFFSSGNAASLCESNFQGGEVYVLLSFLKRKGIKLKTQMQSICTVKRISYTFYTVIFYMEQHLYGHSLYGRFLYVHFLYSSEFIRVKIYTGQNLYGAKFIQFKVYTVIFYTDQNLYSSKFIRYKIYTG